jgi:hypothetical protein
MSHPSTRIKCPLLPFLQTIADVAVLTSRLRNVTTAMQDATYAANGSLQFSEALFRSMPGSLFTLQSTLQDARATANEMARDTIDGGLLHRVFNLLR